MPGEESFATPQAKKICLDGAGVSGTPGKSVTTFEIPPSPCLKRLGFGTGVNVMLYERSPRNDVVRSPWAIKKLQKKISIKSEYAKRLEEEADILKKLQHPNIIGYRGFKRSEDGALILATENGQKSLFDILEEIREEVRLQNLDPDEDEEEIEETPEGPSDEKPHPLPAHHILTVIRAMAGALDYLHTSTLGGKPRLLHGDLKSANVLVKGEFDEIKLCDFGVTLPLNDDGTVSQEGGKNQYIGTEPWSAKEVIEEETITTKTDIYSLGCTIYEMLSLETPHFNKMGDLEDDTNDSIDDSEYQKALGTRPDLPDYLDDFLQDDAYEKILGIFFACTSEDASNRPSAKTVLEILDSHEIWHASTERWSQLGDERGVVQQSTSMDDSANADTEDSSNNSDSVIELSSDEEEEEEINNEESDDSSDIEILEEIPFKPNNREHQVPSLGKVMPESKSPKETDSENEDCVTKEQGSSHSDNSGGEENHLLDDKDVEGTNNHETENTKEEKLNSIKNTEPDENSELAEETKETEKNKCGKRKNEDELNNEVKNKK